MKNVSHPLAASIQATGDIQRQTSKQLLTEVDVRPDHHSRNCQVYYRAV